MAAYPPHVGTIGGTIRPRHGLNLYSLNRGCQHRATLDLASVVARYALLPVLDMRRLGGLPRPSLGLVFDQEGALPHPVGDKPQ